MKWLCDNNTLVPNPIHKGGEIKTLPYVLVTVLLPFITNNNVDEMAVRPNPIHKGGEIKTYPMFL